MDPLSITMAVMGISSAISKLSTTVSHFMHDCKLADEDLNVARNHAILLQEEIKGLESKRPSVYSLPDKRATGRRIANKAAWSGNFAIEEASFEKALSTARDLLCYIEASFALRSEPHTWRSKVRWAIKDKQDFARLMDRLQRAESTLQGIVSMEQL